MSKLYPDAYFKSIHEINPEFFTNKGINTILCDIDNTLITYEEKYPNNEIIKLFNYFSENNLSIILLSNNSKKRVSIVGDSLNLKYIYNSGKPFIKKKHILLKDVNPSKCAVIGDQLFTDILTGKINGFYTVLVPPIKDRTIKDKNGLLSCIKRLLELPILKKYFYKKMNSKEDYIYWKGKIGI